jgi:hypothetical protein
MMMFTLATALLATMAQGTSFDTTLTVRPGGRLEVNNFVGAIAVTTWGRNAVRIAAEQSSRVRTLVQSSEAGIAVRSVGRMGAPGSVDYQITVPRWMELKLSGVRTEISVEGTQAAVSAETALGDVHLVGGKGFIHLSSIQGSVDVRGASGRMEVNSVNEGVKLSDVEGDVAVETINGDIELDDIASSAVEGASVNGDITYSGAMRSGGRYHFTTHDGDVVVVVPVHASANVSVSTFSGDFESSFPVQIRDSRRGKRFSFTLGSGAANLELESFQGAIRLQRADDARAKKED